jgi:transposase
MSFLGLTPSEYSSGAHRQQGGITKSGNTHARRIEHQPKVLPDLSWKAQVRLCKRFRQLSARGKHVNEVVVAIARELSGFLWAIARSVPLPAH